MMLLIIVPVIIRFLARGESESTAGESSIDTIPPSSALIANPADTIASLSGNTAAADTIAADTAGFLHSGDITIDPSANSTKGAPRGDKGVSTKSKKIKGPREQKSFPQRDPLSEPIGSR